MRRQGPMAAIAASPTMVGAVTTLIVIVAVFLAYNANPACRSCPVYRVSVEIPNAARLTNNNEVRIGGHRVGVVESIDAVQPDEATATAQASGTNAAGGQTGGVVARLNLKLDKDAEPLPKDSIFRVRYRSSFGLKYLEIVRGEGDPAPEGFAFDGLDDETDRATACYLPGDPRFASTAERAERLLPAADRVRRHQQHLRHAARGRTRAPTSRASATPSPAAAPRSTTRSTASSRCSPGLRPVTQVLLEPDTQLRALLPRARRRSPDPGAGRRAAGRRLHQGRDRLRRDLLRSGGAAGDDLRGPADAGDRDRPAAARAPVPARLRDAQRGAAPGRQRPAGDPAGAQRRDRGRHPGAAALHGHQPAAWRAPSRSLDRLVTQPTTGVTLQRLQDTFDAAEAAGQVGGPGADRLQLLQLLVHLPARTASPIATRSGFAFRQMLTNIPARPDASRRAAPATRACSPTANGPAGRLPARTTSRSSTPTPISPPASTTPTARADSSATRSARGCSRARRRATPPTASPDLPGSRGPTTLFTNDAGNRELVDTRNASRQPETWGNGR